MQPNDLVTSLAGHNEIGNIHPLVGFWGVADPSDIGNGDRTDDYGKIPLNDPQFQDVLAFIEERCPPSTVRGFFTPTGVGQNQEISNKTTYVVYEHPSGRVMTCDAVDLARAPHVLIFRIVAFSGQAPDQLLDVYPGIDNRVVQHQGSPVDTSAPWPEMGPRCYHPSPADSPERFPAPIGHQPTDEQRARARYRDESQRVFEVSERTIGTSYFGGPPPKRVRVWQVVNW